MPSTGTPSAAAMRAVWSMVPSPPTATSRSAAFTGSRPKSIATLSAASTWRPRSSRWAASDSMASPTRVSEARPARATVE